MEIPSSHAGVVKGTQGQSVGDKVGDARCALIEEAAGGPRRPGAGRCRPARHAATPAPHRPLHPAPAPALAQHPPAPAAAAGRRRAVPRHAWPASPSVRKFARELGVDARPKVQGHRPQGAASPSKTCRASSRRVMAGSERAPARGRRGARGRRRWRGPGPAAVAEGRLHEVRPGRAQGRCRASRRSPAPNLHRNWVMIPHVTQPRRCRHHRPRSLPRDDQQGKREGRASRSRMLAFVIKAIGRGAEEVPRVQRLAWTATQLVLQAVLQHRLRGRHAERPGRAGARRTPTRRACCRSARKWANSPRRRATAS